MAFQSSSRLIRDSHCGSTKHIRVLIVLHRFIGVDQALATEQQSVIAGEGCFYQRGSEVKVNFYFLHVEYLLVLFPVLVGPSHLYKSALPLLVSPVPYYL